MIGEKMRVAREAKGYSQEHVAEEVGISESMYASIENGQTRVRPERVVQIARVLDANPEDWFAEEDGYTVVINHNNAENLNDQANGVRQYYCEQVIEQNTELIHELLVSKDEQIKLLKETVEMLKETINSLKK